MLALAIVGLLAPPGLGEQIPVIAYIANAPPEIIDVDLADGSGSPTGSVDPGSTFLVDVLVRDNNTLSDITEISLTLFSPGSSVGSPDNELNHYSFAWDPSGFRNVGGVGSIMGAQCSSPTDMDLGQGQWRFALSLSKLAERASDWTMLIGVEDEANRTEYVSTLGVTSYISLAVDTTALTFSGQPGDTVAANENPIGITLRSNQPVSLGSRATEFIGVSDPGIVLDPSIFTIDDDPNYGESQESGEPEIVLSQLRQTVLAGLPMGSHTLDFYVFVSIPGTFQDQDYSGSITFEIHV